MQHIIDAVEDYAEGYASRYADLLEQGEVSTVPPYQFETLSEDCAEVFDCQVVGMKSELAS
jgi:hypothetical protein